MSFEIGAKIGPYTIINQIGQGGMATVFKAYHEALDRYVAIKALNPIFLDDPSFLKRFQREAKVVARLEHPNIVPIYDFSEQNGRPYLVMKLIEGETLKDRLNKKKLDNEEILQVITKVGAALSYAHQLDILHRDIKPSNVILANDGQIYLADFGLARLVQAGESTLTSDRLLGTPKYISPEQAMSKPDIDSRADIYSFGAMVYELVVGRVPFEANTPFTVIHDHIYTPLPSPKSVNPDTSDDMDFLISKALQKKPNDRWQTVDEFVSEITKTLNNTAAENQPVDTPSIVQNDITESETNEPLLVRVENTQLSSQSGVVKNEHKKDTKRKPRSCFWIILGTLGGLLLIFGCLAVLGGILERFDKQLIVNHPDNENYQEADILLNQAYEAFEQDEFSEMTNYFDKVNQMMDSQSAYYFDVINQLENQEEYLFAVLVGLSYFRDKPLDEIEPQTLQKLHELIYKAALNDDRVERLFENNPHLDLIGNVALLRFRLYQYEDPQEIKKELNEILNNPIISRRFPEAKLLEIEVFIMIGDEVKVSELSDDILSESQGKIPEWIIIELSRILEEALN